MSGSKTDPFPLLLEANAGALKERLRRLERYGKGRHHPSDEPRRAEASVIIFSLQDTESTFYVYLQKMVHLDSQTLARHRRVRSAACD